MRVGVRVGVGAFGGGVGAHLASINFQSHVEIVRWRRRQRTIST